MNPDVLLEVAQHYCQTNQYQLHRELGRGAFKCAYLIQIGQNYLALKVTEHHTSSSDRLTRELAALSACSHLSIAKLHSVDSLIYNKQNFWITTEEFLAGGTLEEKCKSSCLAPSEVLSIGRALAEAIGHLQQRKLVHRDIKPANVIFRQDQITPVLTDFGIVRVLDSPSLTQDFVAQGPGTPFYAAPEQLNNDKELIDWRTDQFGLAVSLAHCAIGVHPFQKPGMSVRDAIFSVASRNKISDEMSGHLRQLGLGALCKALEPWPVSRYRRPLEFISALR